METKRKFLRDLDVQDNTCAPANSIDKTAQKARRMLWTWLFLLLHTHSMPSPVVESNHSAPYCMATAKVIAQKILPSSIIIGFHTRTQ